LISQTQRAPPTSATRWRCSARPDSAWITGQLIYAGGGASLVDTLMPLEIQRG
jgi:hypothetical protein